MAAFFGELLPIAVAATKAANQIGQRTGDEEILLHETERLPDARRVVGVQHAGDGFRGERFAKRSGEVAAAELLKVEIIGSCRRPESQRVDRLAAVTDDWSIERHADQGGRLPGDGPQTAALQFKGTIQFDFDGLIRPRDLPRIGTAEPVVRLLILPAVADRLSEDAVFIAQPVAHRRKLHRGHRVEETGGESPQPAVSQAGVGLRVEHGWPIEVFVQDSLLDERIEQQVGHVIGQRSSDEKLHREIIDPFGILARVGFVGLNPALREHIAHRAGKGLEALARPGFSGSRHVIEEQMTIVKRVLVAGEFDRPAAVLPE